MIAFSLAVAVVVTDDYGVGWDENVSYATGLVNYQYVFEGNDRLLSHLNRDYGPAFELPAVIIQKALGIEDLRNVYMLRRILTHLLFLSACACIFLLTDLIYKNKMLASMAFLLLWIHPQIFTHSFFNSKDIPFLSFLVISLYFLFRHSYTGKIRWIVMAGIFTGILTATRIPGIIYVGLCCAWILTDRRGVFPAYKRTRALMIFLVAFGAALYAFWPYLWTAPFDHLCEAFRNMSKFRWEGDLLYRGEYVPSTDLPWHYIPHWFSLTTPAFIVACGLVGASLVCADLLKPHGKNRDNVPAGAFFLVAFGLPMIAVIVMGSVLYDGWRHMYFIYGPFVMLCIYAVHRVTARSYTLLFSAAILLLVPPAWHLTVNHPFQYVYFNILAGNAGNEDLRKRYELDYWGMSYRQALEYILEKDTSATIRIAAQNEPVKTNVEFLPPEQKKRIVITGIEQASYFVTNYRWHPGDYNDLPSGAKELKSFKVRGNSVQTVFRLPADRR